MAIFQISGTMRKEVLEMWDDEYIGIRETGQQRQQKQRNEILDMTEVEAHDNE